MPFVRRFVVGNYEASSETKWKKICTVQDGRAEYLLRLWADGDRE